MTNLENPLKGLQSGSPTPTAEPTVSDGGAGSPGLPKCACVHSDADTCARRRDGYAPDDPDWYRYGEKCECDCHDDNEEPFPQIVECVGWRAHGISQACCEGENEYDAKIIAEKITGKNVIGNLFARGGAERLPYPAEPIIWQLDHPVKGKRPAFCTSPKKCAGKGACPMSYACSN